MRPRSLGPWNVWTVLRVWAGLRVGMPPHGLQRPGRHFLRDDVARYRHNIIARLEQTLVYPLKQGVKQYLVVGAQGVVIRLRKLFEIKLRERNDFGGRVSGGAERRRRDRIDLIGV